MAGFNKRVIDGFCIWGDVVFNGSRGRELVFLVMALGFSDDGLEVESGFITGGSVTSVLVEDFADAWSGCVCPFAAEVEAVDVLSDFPDDSLNLSTRVVAVLIFFAVADLMLPADDLPVLLLAAV